MRARRASPGQERARAAVRLRRMTSEDVEAVMDLERAAFPDIPESTYWIPGQLEGHLDRFPEGQLVAESGGRVVGSSTNMITTLEAATRPHTWHSITGNGTLSTHDPGGDCLYGTEVMVHPEVRRMGVGRLLFEARFALVRSLGLRGFATGGRLPGYRAVAEEMTVSAYVDQVVRGERTDPVLTPQLKWGLEPRGVLCGYILDPPSLHHATLVAWENSAWEA